MSPRPAELLALETDEMSSCIYDRAEPIDEAGELLEAGAALVTEEMSQSEYAQGG